MSSNVEYESLLWWQSRSHGVTIYPVCELNFNTLCSFDKEGQLSFDKNQSGYRNFTVVQKKNESLVDTLEEKK